MANMSIQTVIDLFIQNRIPPEWVDRGYTFRYDLMESPQPSRNGMAGDALRRRIWLVYTNSMPTVLHRTLWI